MKQKGKKTHRPQKKFNYVPTIVLKCLEEGKASPRGIRGACM
jgi:hypothetical protein